MSKNGSSPHPRGTHVWTESATLCDRFIPAPAGNTTLWSSWCWSSSVHPRTRGEHSTRSCRCVKPNGSSPHPRGTRGNQSIRLMGARFIPAPAGNTRSVLFRPVSGTVHPRTRGEHRRDSMRRYSAGGSSPHPRGTRQCLPDCQAMRRFIPAPAGNTWRLGGTAASESVHPRTRGEHGASCFVDAIQRGSSPHPRGTRPRRTQAAQHDRFIPAPAGNTPTDVMPQVPLSVHPRTRGEHDSFRSSALAQGGSSPHPRGTHLTQPLD